MKRWKKYIEELYSTDMIYGKCIRYQASNFYNVRFDKRFQTVRGSVSGTGCRPTQRKNVWYGRVVSMRRLPIYERGTLTHCGPSNVTRRHQVQLFTEQFCNVQQLDLRRVCDDFGWWLLGCVACMMFCFICLTSCSCFYELCVSMLIFYIRLKTVITAKFVCPLFPILHHFATLFLEFLYQEVLLILLLFAHF